MNPMNPTKSAISRRNFLMGSAAAATALTMTPKELLADEKKKSPNDKLNIACIGAGGKGKKHSFNF